MKLCEGVMVLVLRLVCWRRWMALVAGKGMQGCVWRRSGMGSDRIKMLG